MTLHTLIAKFSKPWSIEYIAAVMLVSGVALGVLIATGGRQF